MNSHFATPIRPVGGREIKESRRFHRRVLSVMRYVIFAVVTLLLAGPAHATLHRFGVRVGGGTSFYNDNSPTAPADEPDRSLFAIGPAYRVDLVRFGFEADALYWTHRFRAGDDKHMERRLALPLIGKLDVSPFALLKLELGVGLEPRFLLASDSKIAGADVEVAVLYLPVTLSAAINVFRLEMNLEARYEHQMTDHIVEDGDEIRHPHLMVFFGLLY